MVDPVTGAEIPAGQTPPASANNATPPANQGGAPGSAPAGTEQHKQVPIAVMHEERDKRQAAEAANAELRAELEALRSNQQQFHPQPQFQQPYQQPQGPYPTPPPNVREQIDALWQEDVRKGMQAEMLAMMNYRDWVDTKIDNEFDATRGRHAADFSNYEPKIRSYIRSLPIDAKGQPNIVEAAYLMVKGQDTDNIIKARDAEMAKKYQGQFSAQGMNGAFGPAQPASGSPVLTPEERGAAHAMGLSDEDYLKYRGT